MGAVFSVCATVDSALVASASDVGRSSSSVVVEVVVRYNAVCNAAGPPIGDTVSATGATGSPVASGSPVAATANIGVPVQCQTPRWGKRVSNVSPISPYASFVTGI